MSTSILEGTLATMTWPEIERLGQSNTPVLWPCSVLEEHGPHLPIAVDIYLACVLSQKVQACLASSGVQVVLAPPNYWGINNVTAGFPGSFSLRKDTLKALVYDTLASFQRWGFERVYLIDLHGDINHRSTLVEAVAAARLGCGNRAMAIVPYRYALRVGLTESEDWVLIQPEGEGFDYRRFTLHHDYHAGAMETSFMKCYFPEQVNLEIARGLPPTIFEPQDWKKWASGWADARQVIPLGYNGDPASVETEVVEAYLESEARSFAGLIYRHLSGTYSPPLIERK